METWIREGWRAVTPRIVTEDVDGLVAFVQGVFGATLEGGDGPAIVVIGDARVMIGAGGARDAMPAFLYVYVEDADQTWQRALAAGAETIEPPSDLPYGDRRAMVRDRWGNRWQIATWRGGRG